MSRRPRSGAQLGPPLELVCSACGYGAVCRRTPPFCPLCHAVGRWRTVLRRG